MQRPGRRCFGGFIALAILYIILSGVGLHIEGGTPAERLENTQWIATSKNWLDRQICRWLGLCGTMHLNSNGWTWEDVEDDLPSSAQDYDAFWTSGHADPDSWTSEERRLREIPQYVWDHAPYVHLFSGEQYWPSDIAEHLVHISPMLNYTKIPEMEDDRNLTNLNELDAIEAGHHGRFVYLQSDDNVEANPKWLTSHKNIPTMPDPGPGATPDEIVPAPTPDGQLDEQQVFRDLEYASPHNHTHPTLPTNLTPTTDGRCGGNSGYTCQSSDFGQCCSIHGWCGSSKEFCESYCDPLHGSCIDPLAPPPGTKTELRRKHKRDFRGVEDHQPSFGRSKAPAILVVVDKGHGVVDAFWFFFYSFNLGQKVLNIRFGNHVGDWEHTMIRFKNGKPQSVFLSEHNFGDAYTWHALEKYLPNPDGSDTMLGTWSNATISNVAKRPVIYSAIGSHAMYATPGLHPYVLPWGLLHDQTDRGPLWDPAQNVKSFTYDPKNKTVRASTLNPKSPTGWFHYAGHWGDKFYPLSDPRQYRFAGQYHYVNGPTGPKFKNLGRKEVCQGRGPCHVKHWLGGKRPRRMPREDGVEEGGLPGGNSTDDLP